MKPRNILTQFMAGLMLTAFMLPATAQEKQQWVLKESSIVIKGTSSAHDWEMKAMDAHAEFTGIQENEKLQKLNGAKLKIKSSTVVSDNSTMTKKAHEALKTKQHPEITFTAHSIRNISHSGTSFQATIVGNLQLAGQSRTVAIPVNGKYNGNNELILESQYALKMSDFNIDPPTAMLGALKTGNQVSLEFDLRFTGSASQTANK